MRALLFNLSHFHDFILVHGHKLENPHDWNVKKTKGWEWGKDYTEVPDIKLNRPFLFIYSVLKRDDWSEPLTKL